jgi:hypothetical protein
LTKAINIISFDVPFPANYGGVIDVFYKLVWLKKMGVNIHLHCFAYGRNPSKELEVLCETVNYYPRKTGIVSTLSTLPYTVKSRQSKELEANLLANNFPILFEVLHTSYLMNDARFKNRIKIYRHSNIEHDYYNHLAKAEKSLIKRTYLKREAEKLEKFENIVSNVNYIFAVNEIDTNYFQKKYSSPKTTHVPSFHANNEVTIRPGKGEYVLYHGNLSISENYEAAEWLLQNVFSKIKFNVIIAGLNAPGFLKDSIKKYTNVKLIENPPETEMTELLANAHVHCLYTNQTTGLKLKLLNVLFGGRYVVCNNNMLSGTGFTKNNGLFISDNFITEINSCFENEFSQNLIEQRKIMLERFSNKKNIETVIDTIFTQK